MKDLVLIGGGHAHLHVLRTFGARPMSGVRITLVARDVRTPYSGMLPGLIAGHYTREQCHIDLAPLADFAGARLLHDEAVGLECAEQYVERRAGAPVHYDVVSFDIGPTPDLNSVPGALEHAMPLKPIDRLAERWEALVGRVGDRTRPIRFITVGGGAAGVEVTLAMQHGLRAILAKQGDDPEAVSFTLLTQGEILAGHNARVQRWFRDVLAERGVTCAENCAVEKVTDGVVWCAGGRKVDFDELIWATQGGAAAWVGDTGLALDRMGFIKIDTTLRSVSDPNVFAVGDVATCVEHPRPKAGVFAVRQGPPLADNLRRALAGHALRPFVPQRWFLSLISTGDRCAIGSYGLFAAKGTPVWHLKDWIDRRWVRRYQMQPSGR